LRLQARAEPFTTYRILYIIGLFVFFINTSLLMVAPSLTRIIELDICRDYYSTANLGVIGPGGDVPELLCKIKEVQSKAAEVKGVLIMLGVLPGPYRPHAS
jgi:hypothetical protein